MACNKHFRVMKQQEESKVAVVLTELAFQALLFLMFQKKRKQDMMLRYILHISYILKGKISAVTGTKK